MVEIGGVGIPFKTKKHILPLAYLIKLKNMKWNQNLALKITV